MAKYITVVYKVSDRAPANRKIIGLFKEFLQPSNPSTWRIHSISNRDELHRLSLVEDAEIQGALHLVEKVLNHPNIDDVKTIDDL